LRAGIPTSNEGTDLLWALFCKPSLFAAFSLSESWSLDEEVWQSNQLCPYAEAKSAAMLWQAVKGKIVLYEVRFYLQVRGCNFELTDICGGATLRTIEVRWHLMNPSVRAYAV